MDKKEIRQRGKYKGCAISMVGSCLIIFAIIIMMIVSSCTTTRYVPIIEHRTDTVQITKQQRDSIWLHDSIYMHEYQKGDTIFVMSRKWHTKYIERILHDTTYISKRDTIPCPYPVEVEVEKKLTWWQKFRLSMANVILWVLLIWGVTFGVHLFRKKFL